MAACHRGCVYCGNSCPSFCFWARRIPFAERKVTGFPGRVKWTMLLIAYPRGNWGGEAYEKETATCHIRKTFLIMYYDSGLSRDVKKTKQKKLLTVFCYVTNTRPVYEMWHLHADLIHKESFHWGSKKQTNKQKLQWTYLVLVVAKVLFWCLM